MPIVIKEYSWHQTATKISIDLQDIKSNNFDIFITEDYLKVSANPYIFEAFLPQKINVDLSHGTKTQNSIKLGQYWIQFGQKNIYSLSNSSPKVHFKR